MKPLKRPDATVILRASNAITNKIPTTMAAKRISTSSTCHGLSHPKQCELPRDRLRLGGHAPHRIPVRS